VNGGGDLSGLVRKVESLRSAQLLCAGILRGGEVDRVLVAYRGRRRDAQGRADADSDLIRVVGA
jgi:hypothetical protein